MFTRLAVQRALGAIWLLDGLLQLKPKMFTSVFLSQVLLPSAQGQPMWISSLVVWGVHLVQAHIILWNALFAIIQITIGLGLIFNYKVKEIVIGSIVWSLIVWVFGEGLGQVLSWQTLVLTGAPGAALLYALVAIAIWPNELSFRDWHKTGVAFSRYAIGVFWIIGSALHFQGTYLTAKGLSSAISVPWLSNVVGGHGMVISIILAILEFILGVLFIANKWTHFAIIVSIIAALLFWWVGQSFGQVFEALSTDVNSGPIIILLTLCALPKFPKLSRHERVRS